MDIISTRQVAELLAVSEATIKRWADAGTIRCFRTPGGHRKFRLVDVADFLKTNHYEVNGPLTPSAPDASEPAASEPAAGVSVNDVAIAAPPVDTEAVDKFRTLALSGDTDALVSLIARLRLRGLSFAAIFDTVATPSLADIGDRWARGTITVSQEHIASASVVEALARLRPLIERVAPDRGRAVFACPGEEQHDLGLRMSSLLAYSIGYTPVFVAARVPVPDLALLITAERPIAAVLSATYTSTPLSLREDVLLLAEVCRSSGTTLFTGGGAMTSLRDLPANVVRVHNFTDLLARLTALA